MKISQVALDTKATDLAIFDVSGQVSYADLVIVCSASSDRQVTAVADNIRKALVQCGVKPSSTEGLSTSRWVLLDFGDVVVHVLHEAARIIYDIDGLWPHAQQVDVPGYDRRTDYGYVNFG